MEHGSPNVTIGTWIKALDILNEFDELEGLIALQKSLAERYEINTDRAAGVPGVFEGVLSDDWGRKLLAKKANISRLEQTVPKKLNRIMNMLNHVFYAFIGIDGF